MFYPKSIISIIFYTKKDIMKSIIFHNIAKISLYNLPKAAIILLESYYIM